MKLAVVRVRGVRKLNPKIVKTMDLLLLKRPNHCVLVDDSPQTVGMLGVVKDYVTFGPVSESTIHLLLSKRGMKGSVRLNEVSSDADLKKAAKEIFAGGKTANFADPVFCLTPPSKGYKNIKKQYPDGALGKRIEIDSLLKRMI